MTFEEQMEEMIQGYNQVLSPELIMELKQDYENYLGWKKTVDDCFETASRAQTDWGIDYQKNQERAMQAWFVFQSKVEAVQQAILGIQQENIEQEEHQR